MFAQIAVLLCFCAVIEQSSCSSIPMWEYLTKDEKMAYLYSMFRNQVDEFCEFSEMEDCPNQLTRYGLRRLKEMPENHLDEMDPYQRGASSIIWNSMMEGHEMMKTTPRHRTTSTTTAKPNSFEDESFSDDSYGSQGAASAKIDNVYRVPPPKGFVYVNSVQPEVQESIQSGSPLYRYPSNSIPVADFEKGSKLYYKYPTTALPRNNGEAEQQGYQQAPRTGPLVVRVHPDGTPVEDRNGVPQDEDLRQYMLSKVVLPEY